MQFISGCFTPKFGLFCRYMAHHAITALLRKKVLTFVVLSRMMVSMKVETYFIPTMVAPARLATKNAVVIDVLRASTSMVTALANGAKLIIPCDSVEKAFLLKSQLGSDHTLLAGERKGFIVAGFDMGNSPLEFTPEKVKDKTIVFTTTNGSRAVLSAAKAEHVLVAALVNLSAVVKFLLKDGRDAVLLCAGKEGNFSLEDSVCAGAIIAGLSEKADVELDDCAKTVSVLYRRNQNFLKLLKESEHGQYLARAGITADFEPASEVDKYPLVPVFKNNKIELAKKR